MKTILQKVYVSFNEMESAFNSVRQELRDLGLLRPNSPLDKVNCYHESLTIDALPGLVGVKGLFDPADGDIHFPAVYTAGLFPWRERQTVDVIRHEFGRALAYKYKGYFRGGVFKATFGMRYEDFADVFVLFMKYKGMLPPCYLGKWEIEKKWKAVEIILNAISTEITMLNSPTKGRNLANKVRTKCLKIVKNAAPKLPQKKPAVKRKISANRTMINPHGCHKNTRVRV